MSNEEKEYKYVQFPLCLIRETYSDLQKAMNLILDYGIVNYALKLHCNMRNVAKQLIYDYARNQDVLQASILKKMSEVEDTLSLEDEYLFDPFGTFEPNEEITINPILELLESDPKLKADAILSYQINLAVSKDHLNLTNHSNDDTIKRYNEALRIKTIFEREFGADAMPTCKAIMVIQFRDNPKDIELFRAYIGIKSIIGNRNFITGNKPAILSRMVGLKSKKAFEYYTTNRYNKDKNILPTIEKFSKRYQMDKLLFTLVERKFIMYLNKPKVSVIYFSKYMEPGELADLIIKSKSKQNLKNRMKDAAASL
jgi:hypothetical protein